MMKAFKIFDWTGEPKDPTEYKTYDDADEALNSLVERLYPETVDSDPLFYESKGEYYIEEITLDNECN